eukprot:900026-Amorphochlora_amoeboformis.AAC.1
MRERRNERDTEKRERRKDRRERKRERERREKKEEPFRNLDEFADPKGINHLLVCFLAQFFLEETRDMPG